MKLVAMLRIKNQKLTIRECLDKLSQLVDEIVIVDNGSTDGTLDIYSKFSKIVKINKTSGFNEGRDKILAHKMAKSRKPDWIIWIDGDEIFEKSTTRLDFDKYMHNPNINRVTFRMYNFWMSEKHYRVDGIWHRYTAFPQRSLWRNLPQAFFENIPFHSGDVKGLPEKTIISPIRLKHFGYITKTQIKNREITYGKLKYLKQSQKTLPRSDINLKTRTWRYSKNRPLNQLIQQKEHLSWKIARGYYRALNFLVPNSPIQKDN
jgi:glycosyltransferase involved in cell wall biosynthesis